MKTIIMRPPGRGWPLEEVEDKHDVLVQMMVKGYTQVVPPVGFPDEEEQKPETPEPAKG